MIRILFVVALVPIVGFSQIKNKPGKDFPVSKSVDKIVLDGELSEQTWKLAERGRDFYVSKPIDSIAAAHQTFFQIAFDENFFYVAF